LGEAVSAVSTALIGCGIRMIMLSCTT
jgi:hypothetical protein